MTPSKRNFWVLMTVAALLFVMGMSSGSDAGMLAGVVCFVGAMLVSTITDARKGQL